MPSDPVFAHKPEPPPQKALAVPKEGPSQLHRERIWLQLLSIVRRYSGENWARAAAELSRSLSGANPGDYFQALGVAYQIITGEAPNGDPALVAQLAQEIVARHNQAQINALYHIKTFKAWYEAIRDEGIL